MKVKIEIPVSSVSDISTHYITIDKEMPLFPLFTIGKDSYIIDADIYMNVKPEFHEGFSCTNLHIGRFCSISQNVLFHMGNGHNYKCVAMGVTELLANAPLKDVQSNNNKGSIIIQNDVWIGNGVTIMSGVTVHNGAVIAANAHVVRDVPPYAIVGGNPAQIIGYRFKPDIIEQLLTIQWWYWSDEKIRENAIYFSEDVERFCHVFYAEALERLETLLADNRLAVLKDTERIRYLLIPDFDSTYAAYIWVINQFLENYSKKQGQLLIVYITRRQMAEHAELIEEINKIICLCQQKQITGIKIVTEEECSLYGIFKNVTHYIMTRDTDTVRYTCIADYCGVNCISGVDKPVFRI